MALIQKGRSGGKSTDLLRITRTGDEICAAFEAADDETGGEKSTVFLLSITADRMGVEYSDVVDALHARAKAQGLVKPGPAPRGR